MVKQAKGAKQIKRTVAGRKFFTVADDLEIYNIKQAADTQPASTVAKNAAIKLNRSFEAVRDRLRRFISKISAADLKKLQAAVKANPKQYVHFKADSDKKEIDRITTDFPQGVQAGKAGHKIKKEKKAEGKKADKGAKADKNKKRPKKEEQPEQKFAWVREKLSSKDIFFRVDFGVKMVVALLNHLILTNETSKDQAQEYLNGVLTNQTIDDILRHFKGAK